jgi:hypothetical protein
VEQRYYLLLQSPQALKRARLNFAQDPFGQAIRDDPTNPGLFIARAAAHSPLEEGTLVTMTKTVGRFDRSVTHPVVMVSLAGPLCHTVAAPPR